MSHTHGRSRASIFRHRHAIGLRAAPIRRRAAGGRGPRGRASPAGRRPRRPPSLSDRKPCPRDAAPCRSSACHRAQSLVYWLHQCRQSALCCSAKGKGVSSSPSLRRPLHAAHPARSVRCGCSAPVQLCPAVPGQADRPGWQARTPWSPPFCGVCHPLAAAVVNVVSGVKMMDMR
jgi:hypothetical protein